MNARKIHHSSKTTSMLRKLSRWTVLMTSRVEIKGLEPVNPLRHDVKEDSSDSRRKISILEHQHALPKTKTQRSKAQKPKPIPLITYALGLCHPLPLALLLLPLLLPLTPLRPRPRTINLPALSTSKNPTQPANTSKIERQLHPDLADKAIHRLADGTARPRARTE